MHISFRAMCANATLWQHCVRNPDDVILPSYLPTYLPTHPPLPKPNQKGYITASTDSTANPKSSTAAMGASDTSALQAAEQQLLIVQNALDEVQSTKDREMSELSQTAAELHQAIAHLNIAAPAGRDLNVAAPDGGGNVSPLKRAEKESSPATTTNATNALPSAAPAVVLPTAPSRAEPSSDGSNGQQPGGVSYAQSTTVKVSAAAANVQPPLTLQNSAGSDADEESNPFSDEGDAAGGHAVYKALYTKRAASTADDLGAVEVAALLEESGLDNAALRSVWNAAKKDRAVGMIGFVPGEHAAVKRRDKTGKSKDGSKRKSGFFKKTAKGMGNLLGLRHSSKEGAHDSNDLELVEESDAATAAAAAASHALLPPSSGGIYGDDDTYADVNTPEQEVLPPAPPPRPVKHKLKSLRPPPSSLPPSISFSLSLSLALSFGGSRSNLIDGALQSSVHSRRQQSSISIYC